MSLRAQLLLISLLTLALPWAGWQYVREVGLAQRRAQQAALLASAAVVASSLRGRVDLLYRDERLATAPRRARDVYARALQGPVRLDGYADEWIPALALQAAPLSGGAPTAVSYTAGVFSRSLYLFVSVQDDSPRGYDPVTAPFFAYDQVLLVVESDDGATVAYRFPAQGTGPVSAIDAQHDTPAPRLQGHTRNTAHGYTLELRVPLDLVGARFGFVALDATAAGFRGWAGTAYPSAADGLPEPGARGADPGLLIYPSPALDARLREFGLQDLRLRVVDKAGWNLGSAGGLQPASAPVRSPAHGFRERLLRLALGAGAEELAAYELDAPQAPEALRAALTGEPSVGWYRLPGGDRVVIAAQPISADGDTIGAVLLERRSDTIVTLGDQALSRFMGTTLAISALAALLLLAYASVLSLRIRALRNAAAASLGPRGLLHSRLPGGRARDEIGDLSRSFSTLLERLREHQDYLQSLASKLSHELRTPLAVVRSSLDNLAAERNEHDREGVYLERARDGVERLQGILVAMSEASRVEQAIASAEPEEFDLVELVDGNVQAYRGVYPAKEIRWRSSLQRCLILGVPELLVQLLDKLVANAADFGPPDGLIEIVLSSDGASAVIAVSNEGPPLPAQMRARLFDSMVSVRAGGSDTPHLGFGLYIARLIAEYHGGRIEADNLPGDTGAMFRVYLRHAGSG